MDRKWIVQTEGKEHVVEVEYGTLIRDEEDPGTFLQTDGKLVIDGNETQTWEGGKLPKELSFDIEGKPAILRKKGLFVKNLELSFEGEQIKPSQLY